MGHPVVAVTVAVGRNVHDSASVVGISISIVVKEGVCRAATSMGFAATSALVYSVFRSWVHFRHFGNLDSPRQQSNDGRERLHVDG